MLMSRWWAIEIIDLGRFDITLANGQVQVVDFALFKGRRNFAVEVVPNRPRGLHGWVDWNRGDPRFSPYLVVPLWCPAIVAFLLTILAWCKLGRHPSECRKCGYDRTGLAPGVVCPECGAPSRATTAQSNDAHVSKA
jgi:hypothetical protein